MKLLILSDIHDHLWKLGRILTEVSADALICCGDLCSPFVMARLANDFKGPIHMVFGNNDADQFRITRIAMTFGEGVYLHGELGQIEIDGLKIVINHFDYIARDIAASGLYDVVCFGHNHQREIDHIRVGKKEVHLINPGPVMGVKFDQGTPIAVASSFAVFDTQSREASLWTFDDCAIGEGPHQLA